MLVIPKPDTKFSEVEKFKLDQYIMRGGRVLWTIDQVNAELDSLKGHGGEQMSFPKQLDLDDQLFTYGVRINYDLIADMSCAQIPLSYRLGGWPGPNTAAALVILPNFYPCVKKPGGKKPGWHTQRICQHY